MKKFTIFFLMVFMYLGNQAKCETVLASSGDDVTVGRNFATWFSHHSVNPNASGMIASDNTYRSSGVYEANRVKATQSLQVHIEGPAAACSSAFITLHAVVSDDAVTANTSYQYVWLSSTSHGAGFSAAAGASNNQELVVDMSSVSQVMYYKVYVQRYEGSVCQGPADTSAVFTLTRVERGTVSVTATPAEACAQKTLTATTSSSAMVARWIWLKDGANVANTGTNNTYVATAAGEYKAVAEYEGSNLCNDTSSAVTVAFATSSTIHLSAATASLVPDELDFVCPGGQVLLTATGGTAPYSFYRNGTLIGTSNGTLTDSPTNTGTVAYSIVDAGGCTADTTFTVTNFADLIIQTSAGSHYCATAYDITIFSNILDPIYFPEESYTWFFNGLPYFSSPRPTEILMLHNFPAPSPEPYSVILEVNDANRNCFLRSNDFELWVHPQPTATIIADSVCEGSDATVTVVTDGYLGDNPTYAWSTNVTGTTATGTIAALSAPTTVAVTVTAFGQVTCKATATASVDVVNTVATGEITSSDLVCSGTDVVFSAEAIGAGFTNPVYTWGGDASGSDATATVANVTAAKTVTVTVTGDNAPSTACSVTATKTVEVMTALPAATDVEVNVYMQGSPHDVTTDLVDGACMDAAVDVVAEGLGFTPSDEYIYTWYRNGVQLPAQGLAFTDHLDNLGDVEAAYIVQYTLVISHVNGCGSVTIEGTPIPVFQRREISLIGDTHVCTGTPVTLIVVNHDASLPVPDYAWYLDGNGPLGNPGYSSMEFSEANGNEMLAQVAPHNVTVVAYIDPLTGNFAGCTSIATASIDVYVDPRPTVQISAIDTVLCENGEITLTAVPSREDIPYMAFVWSTGDTMPSITVNAAGTYTVDLTQLVDPSIPNPSCTATASIEIVEATKPTVTLDADFDTICSGSQVTLTATATFDALAGDSTYTWYRNGMEVATTSSNTYTDILTAENQVSTYIYNVVASQASSGCVSEVATDTVRVAPLHTVYVTGTQLLCNSLTETALTANVMPAGNYTYKWYQDGAEQTSTDATLNATGLTLRSQPYVFIVEVTNTTTGCVVASEAYNVYNTDSNAVYITATPDSICSGTPVTLTADVVGSADEVSYTWSMGDQTANSVVVTEPGTYNVTVTDLTTRCTATGSVEVKSATAPTLTIAPTSAEICAGEQVTLTVRGAADGQFTWTENGVLLSAVDSVLTVMPQPVNNHVDTFVYNINYVQPSTGCTATVDPAKVIVHPNPAVAITADTTVICLGEEIVLTAVDSLGITGSTTYVWKEQGRQVQDGAANTYTATPDAAGIYTYTVDAVNHGCSSTSVPFNVIVNAQPVVAISVDDTTICVSGSATFNVQPAVAGVAYNWTIDGTVYTASEFTHQFTAANTYKVVCEAVQAGCTAKDSVNVEVSERPVVTLTVTPDAICSGSSDTLKASVTNGVADDLFTYTWYRNGNQFGSGVNDTTHTDNPVAMGNNVSTYTYGVMATQPSSGCQSDVNNHTIAVYPAPTVAINGDNILCAGGTVNLTAVASDTIAGTTYTYSWRMDNAAVTGSANTYSTTLALRDNPYIFTVQITNEATGCTATSEEFPVYVDTLGNISVSASDTAICKGGEVTLTSNFLGSNNSDITYQWSEGTTPITGATSDTYTATNLTANTTFNLEATQVSTGCKVNGSVTIAVKDDPTATLTLVTEQTICSGTQATLTVVGASGVTDVPYTYTWYKNGVEIAGVSGDSLSEVLTAEGINTVYTYTVVASQDVTGCQSVPSEAKTVTVVPAPTVTIDGDALICSNPGQVTLNARINDTVGTMTYN